MKILFRAFAAKGSKLDANTGQIGKPIDSQPSKRRRESGLRPIDKRHARLHRYRNASVRLRGAGPLAPEQTFARPIFVSMLLLWLLEDAIGTT
jgi:hypothetical protein